MTKSARPKRRALAWVLAGVVLGATSAAYGAAKLTKEQIPQIAAYCTTVQEPQDSYGPCPVTGKSIATLTSDGSGKRGTSIAIGADGVPVIAAGGDNALTVVKCADIGCTVSKRTVTVVDATQSDNPSIAIGADHNPVISYQRGNQDLFIAKCADPACKASTLRSPGAGGAYDSLTIGSDGFPVISYYDEVNDDLKVSRCGDVTCAGITTQAVDVTGNVGRYTSIAIGTDGFPVISYMDVSNNALKVVKCDDAGCSGTGETFTALDIGTFTGTFTSIAVGTDGRPVISYVAENGGNNETRVARCADPACTSSSIQTLHTSPTMSTTSLAIGTDGNPVISFHPDDLGPFDLHVAKCNDPACSGNDEVKGIVEAIPTDDLVESSIAIGVDGNPVISYFDFATNLLKVARVTR